MCVCIYVRFFFFSSRRRHTRCGRDWSSDVCSSDLVPLTTNPVVAKGHDAGLLPTHIGDKRDRWLELGTSWFQHPEDFAALPVADGPSEWQRITVAPDGQKTDDRHLARVKPVQT